MKTHFKITMPFEPVPKGRARIARSGGTMYTPCKTRKFETSVALFLRTKFWLGPLSGALSLKVIFRLPKGSSVRRNLPCVRPDLDNYVKAICDAANGIIWIDDGQICSIEAHKVYANYSQAIGIELEVLEL